MPAPSLCVVSGVVYDENGAPAVGVTIYLTKVLLNGVLIGTAPIGSASIPGPSDHTVFYIEAITSDAVGAVSFTVPQLSTVYLEGNVSGYNNGEVALSIPATATATLESLTPATFPIDVTTFTFLSLVDTPDDYTGDALKIVRVNAAGTALEFATAGAGYTDAEADARIALAVGVSVQAFDADLVTLAGSISAFGLSLVDDANAAAGRTTLELSSAHTPTFLGLLTGTGLVGINKAVPVSQLHSLSNAIGVIPFIAEGPAGQTASLQEWRVNGSAIATCNASGSFSTSGSFITTGNSVVGRGSLVAFNSNTNFALASTFPIAWNASATYSGGAFDTSLSRQAAGIVQVGDGAANANGKVRAAEYQVATIKVLGAQGAAVADATDNPSAITQLNALLARLRAHGIIAT